MSTARQVDPDEQWALQTFPNLARGFRKTSDKTLNYNCLAWALGITSPWVTPLTGPGYYWPPGIVKEWSIAAAREVLSRDGYASETTDRSLEPGWEKVAIYAAANGDLLHFARQLPSGAWTSKLGRQIDIEHVNLECLEGIEYGMVTLLLKRRTP